MNNLDLNKALFVGIDAHPSEHTALIINRFEDQKGVLRFENTKMGISTFLCWLNNLLTEKDNVVFGVEGGGSTRKALLAALLREYNHIYEVNPLYTKQRRQFGTRPDKSDPVDAKLIAEVLTKKLPELPRIKKEDLCLTMFSLKKIVWFYEDITYQKTSLQNQLHQLKRERKLANDPKEKEILNLIIKRKLQQLKNAQVTQRECIKKLSGLLVNQGDNLTTIKGINTVLAAKIVAHSGGIGRFANLNGFIRYAGIAPLEKSSGKSKRHVKNQMGNRKLNSTLFLAAMSQLRWNFKAKVYFDKKIKEGKTKKHALRCLMKRITCIVYGMLKGGGAYRG